MILWRRGKNVRNDNVCDNIDYYKIYESIWRNMERENTLINYRIQWAIALTGGILVTEGILVTGVRFAFDTRPAYFIGGESLTLMLILSCIALYFCVHSREGVEAAFRQIDYLRDEYRRHTTSREENLFEETLKLPRPFGAEAEHFQGHKAARVFPGMMVAIWIGFVILESLGAIFFFGLFANQIQSAWSSSPETAPQQQSAPAEHP